MVEDRFLIIYNMKVVQTISGLSASSGGPSTCVCDLLKALQNISSEIKLVTLETNDDLGKDEPWSIFLENDKTTPLGISDNMKEYLRKSDADIIHTNGLWSYTNHISAKIAREKSIPFILTPHGMLIADALRRHYWKKWPLLKLWFEKDIANAACLHATCKAEAEHIRRFGYKGPIAVIPNPMPSVQWKDDIEEHHEMKRIGFVGRLHPVKRVDVLLDAWKALGKKVDDAELVIIGSGTREYEKYLRDKAAECKYGKIIFRGFVNGKEKFKELASLRTLCLVSKFENFGMTVTEALSVGTPVIASLTTPWEDLNKYECGWWIDATVNNIAGTIEEALGLNNETRIKMADNGVCLVNEKYSSKRIGKQMYSLYKWLIEGGEKPQFIL